MNNSDELFPILELGSTYARLGIFNKLILNTDSYFEKKIDFTRDNLNESHKIFNLITDAEKYSGMHLNDLILLIDSSSIHSLDYTIQKNYDKKIITLQDIKYLINESTNIIKLNNKEKEILHTINSKLIFDDDEVEKFQNITSKVNKVTLELKFIMINKKLCDTLKNLFFSKHISLKEIFCISYIKSSGLIERLNISGYSSFIDIGHKKSSLTIFKDNKILYLNNISVGGDHITKDISKILNIDYRKAEAKKIKFSKNNIAKEDELLKNVINARLEEIIELLFLKCPLIKNNVFKSNLNLYFIGNGSKVLNENLLSFGSEFNFINEMSIIEEGKQDVIESAIKFVSQNEKMQPKKPIINLENKGFFEKLFEYFTGK